MDKTEKIVKRFLESEDHREIIFEPEGNSTSPDFSINGDTAVEAAVLQFKGLDNDKIISLTRTLQKDIFKYSKKKNFRSFKDHKGNSYFLRLKIKIKNALDSFITNPFTNHYKQVLPLGDFSLIFYKGPYDKEKLFIEFVIIPEKSGGWKGVDSANSIKSAAKKKKKKMEKALSSQSKYKKKWLVLWDYAKKTKKEVKICENSGTNYWDRIVVIDIEANNLWTRLLD
jgi:hypothetical protein